MSKISTQNKVRKLAYSTEQMREYMRTYRAKHPTLNYRHNESGPKKPGRKKSQERLLEIAKMDWAQFPLEWKAVREWIKVNSSLWNISEDKCLWEHLPLDLISTKENGVLWEPPWIPTAPYYSRMGSVISFEDYCIENIDRAIERNAAYV